MGLKDPRWRKLTKLVTNHVLSHVNGDERLPVVNCEVQADKVGSDHGAAAPSLDGLLVVGLDRNIDLAEELLINEGTFFKRAGHVKLRIENFEVKDRGGGFAGRKRIRPEGEGSSDASSCEARR